jgi:hypothetical protein
MASRHKPPADLDQGNKGNIEHLSMTNNDFSEIIVEVFAFAIIAIVV